MKTYIKTLTHDFFGPQSLRHPDTSGEGIFDTPETIALGPDLGGGAGSPLARSGAAKTQSSVAADDIH
jgi:hypothetical protein